MTSQKSSTSSLPADEPFDCDEIAEEFGLEVTRRRSVLRMAQLEGRRKGVLVRVEADQSPQYRDEDGAFGLKERKLSHYEMKVTVLVHFKFGAGPKMQLLREGTFRSWLKQFGYQDIEIGDNHLDFQLTIKGKPEEEIKKILLDNLGLIRMHCNERVATLPQSDGKEISAKGRLSTFEREKGIAGLSTLIDLLVSLASTDLVGAEALLALPGSQEEWSNQGVWAARLEGASEVRFVPKRMPSGFVSRASVANPASVPDGSFSGSEREAISQHFGNPHLIGSLGNLQDSRIEIDSKVIALCWPSLVEAPERLMAGARLLALMVNPQHPGAYR